MYTTGCTLGVTDGVYHRVYLGCTWGIYHRVYRVYTRWCIPRVVYTQGGICPPTYHGGYTSLPTSLLCLPGYTPVHTRPTYHWVHCSTVCDVQGVMALGSNLGFSLGMRRIVPSCLQRCERRRTLLRRVTPVLPGRTDKDWIDEG